MTNEQQALNTEDETDFISYQRREHLIALQKGTIVWSLIFIIFIAILNATPSESKAHTGALLIPILLLIGGTFSSYQWLISRKDYAPASRLYVITLLLVVAAMMIVARPYAPVLRNIAPFGLVLIAPVAALLLSAREAMIYVAIGIIWVLLFDIFWGGK